MQGKVRIVYFALMMTRWIRTQQPEGDMVPCAATAAAGGGGVWSVGESEAAEMVGYSVGGGGGRLASSSSSIH